jgi:hypothetical protein
LVVCALMLPQVAARAEGPGLFNWFTSKKDQDKTPTKAPVKTTAKKPVAATKSSPLGFLGIGDKSPAAKPAPKSMPAKKPASPGMFTKMGNSTKHFFSNTKSALTPSSMKKPAPAKSPTGYAARTGTAAAATTKSATKPAAETEPKGNILTSWFSPKKKEPEKSKTVSEWIGRPRPE